jgi:hypothetical protein
VAEHREQPPLCIRLPAVDHGEQGDRARDRQRSGERWSFQRPQLAALRAVDDFPPSRAQLLAKGIGGGEVALAPALDALGEKSLGVPPD